jgi:hypothetical protein
LPPKADIRADAREVGLAPKADVMAV